ncbi:cytochrome P450 2H1-like [Pecten maximus]|uniref:cytochrome P450 2H1-like n=1 Tax=Pecten maximus TaxID=6579 RepID=UPI00145830EA|nr:cytochrome P450 2H1-like [Pecten maximus]
MASDKMPTRTFRKLRKKYGDIFSIRVGTQLLVVLNGYDVIKDALFNRAEEFSDRDNNFMNRILEKGREYMYIGANLAVSALLRWQLESDLTTTCTRVCTRVPAPAERAPSTSNTMSFKTNYSRYTDETREYLSKIPGMSVSEDELTSGSLPGMSVTENDIISGLLLTLVKLIFSRRKLRKTYGDIFSIRVGTQLLVVLNGYDVIKDALVKRADEFSDRPILFIDRILTKSRGLLASSGENWKQTRTFCLTALREFGFGKKSLEAKVKEEVDVFLDDIGQHNGEPFDINEIAQSSVSNVISSIVFGRRFDHNDEEFKSLLSKIDPGPAGPTSIVNTFPVLRFLPGDPFGIKTFLKKLSQLRGYFRTSVEKHIKMFDPNSPQDLIDAFIKENPNTMRTILFSDVNDNLDFVILHLFVAGAETTTTIIHWAIVYLLRNPDVQVRMFQEIECVVGLSRLPTVADRPNLNYCDAFITEILRRCNIVPLSIPHGALKDIHFRGYRIPKGCTILPNFDSILSDHDIFPNPERFDPTRFLDDQGKFCGAEKVVAFSLGRRACLGEALGRMEMFLFLTSFVQRYDVVADDPGNLPSEEGIFGLTYRPEPYKFRAITRG